MTPSFVVVLVTINMSFSNKNQRYFNRLRDSSKGPFRKKNVVESLGTITSKVMKYPRGGLQTSEESGGPSLSVTIHQRVVISFRNRDLLCNKGKSLETVKISPPK